MIKMFEKFKEEKYYWLVPTDDRFHDSLKEIGVPQKVIYTFFNHALSNLVGFSKNSGKDDPDLIKYMYVSFDNRELHTGTEGWGYNHLDGKFVGSVRFERNSWYERWGYKFMGRVNIPDYEFDANKYNL